jgi:Mlc titration factor MtfA (ptsG expression regulator)
MGLLDFLSRKRRRRVIEQTPLSDREWRRACAQLPFLEGLSPGDLAQLRELVVLFLDEKEMAGAGGLALTNGIRLSIAIQACLPVLKLGLEYYAGWVGIVVYPGEFVAPRTVHDETGVVHEYDEAITGEAWSHGPVLLSWEDATQSGEGYNVVIHEFAHKLDMLNGDADGMPPLHADMDRKAWHDALALAYEDFCKRVDRDEDTVIDPYAAEAPGEFFAVMSEAFFEIPGVVLAEYPELYAQFRKFYRQDPAARPAR